MSSLTVMLTENEKLALANELEKLFALQDRPLPNPKKAILIQELIETGLPLRALTAGIRALAREDLKTIKLGTLIEAAREFLYGGDTIVPCSDCSSMGLISMEDADRNSVALACTCPEGNRFRSWKMVKGYGLVTWNGLDVQFSNGRELRRC